MINLMVCVLCICLSVNPLELICSNEGRSSIRDLFRVLHIFPAGVVGFSTTRYSVRETSRYVLVCVRVTQPRGSCPIQQPFNVTLDTFDVTAGTDTL